MGLSEKCIRLNDPLNPLFQEKFTFLYLSKGSDGMINNIHNEDYDVSIEL